MPISCVCVCVCVWERESDFLVADSLTGKHLPSGKMNDQTYVFFFSTLASVCFLLAVSFIQIVNNHPEEKDFKFYDHFFCPHNFV